jgi:hypothetical protein
MPETERYIPAREIVHKREIGCCDHDHRHDHRRRQENEEETP